MITFIVGLLFVVGALIALTSILAGVYWLYDQGILQIIGSLLFVVALIGGIGYEIYLAGQWVLSL